MRLGVFMHAGTCLFGAHIPILSSRRRPVERSQWNPCNNEVAREARGQRRGHEEELRADVREGKEKGIRGDYIERWHSAC